MNTRAKRRLPAIIAGLVVVLAAVGVLAYFFPLLKVGQINVEGTVNADVAQIQDASGIATGDNMLRLDTSGAAQTIAHVPWVEKVTVSRHWPTSVNISITEHRGVGVINRGGTLYDVNEHGQIFLQGAAPEGAVEFKNVDPQDSAAVKAAADAVVALSPELVGQLDRVEAKSAESVELFFHDGRRVFWGSSERASEKAEATRVVLTREGQEWNVSNPAMPTVRT
ncbi:cell division protein FtsQ/DivIB [Corynebacterium anserum]|uniref:FtsQ-type POTRA domain-containing protein n=1 Tax=Corynebacterium anserum TaxID=2684406 RepID=A0A7G7YMY8_9CORY|nr:FtsQ-type POTRA domain-containing protein [Corynebacterium anserum]MBC2680910.1 FtsQ-type POTRA domain-containing protein [Corynebacterium anserum]QNH95858.1 FtsQ-type POTRA domain-containing protein [Corynebacterium anserum]